LDLKIKLFHDTISQNEQTKARIWKRDYKKNYKIVESDLSKLRSSEKTLSERTLIDQLVEIEKRDNKGYGFPSKLSKKASKHMIEIISEFKENTNDIYSTSSYSRWIIFDDLWIEKNYDLAMSIIDMKLNCSVLD